MLAAVVVVVVVVAVDNDHNFKTNMSNDFKS